MDYRVQAWKMAVLRSSSRVAELEGKSGVALDLERLAALCASETLREAEKDQRYTRAIELLRQGFTDKRSHFDTIECITDLFLEYRRGGKE